MTQPEQKMLVSNLCDSIKLQIISQIEAGKIPGNWDGFELRQLIFDNAKNETMFRDKRNSRYKDYYNTVLCDNL